MITATFYYHMHDSIDVNFPVQVGRHLMVLQGEAPYKCVVSGFREYEDDHELDDWATGIRRVLKKDGEFVVDLKTNAYEFDSKELPATGQVDKQEENKVTGPENSEIMKFFEYEHLPLKLQAISKMICQAAEELNETLPNGEEKYAGLRKLLEAKDCFVRAAYLKEDK